MNGLNQDWFEKFERKPPDPEIGELLWSQRRLRLSCLSKAVTTVLTLPKIRNASSANLITGMARKICTGKWTANESSTLHDLLRETNNQALIALVSGMYAIVDTGCTTISTFDESDFLPCTLTPATHKQSIGGIGGALQIKGTGKVKHEVLDNFGRSKYLQGDYHLVEGLPVRLIPPQRIIKSREDGDYSIDGKEGGFFVYKSDGGIVGTPIDPASNLPMVTLFRDASTAS